MKRLLYIQDKLLGINKVFLFLLITDGLVRKKPIQRQSSADNSFPTIINIDEDMVMV